MSEQVFGTPQQPQLHYVTPPVQPSKYTREEVVPGVVLENYIKRQPDEDGKYVLVTTHSERLERIKQPEEIAAEKRATRIGAAIFGTIAAGFVGLMAYVAYKDDQHQKNVSQARRSLDEVKAVQNEQEFTRRFPEIEEQRKKHS